MRIGRLAKIRSSARAVIVSHSVLSAGYRQKVLAIVGHNVYLEGLV
jgi:hypothetical protein